MIENRRYMELADVFNVPVEKLIKEVLKLHPESEFNVKKLSKELICEFIDEGVKPEDDMALWIDDPERYEADDVLCMRVSMKKARIILPVLEKGEIHLADGNWGNTLREDIPEEVLLMCDFKPDLWEKGYYGSQNNAMYIRYGLEAVTNYRSVSDKGQGDMWFLEINEKGRQLLEWFREKQ